MARRIRETIKWQPHNINIIVQPRGLTLICDNNAGHSLRITPQELRLLEIRDELSPNANREMIAKRLSITIGAVSKYTTHLRLANRIGRKRPDLNFLTSRAKEFNLIGSQIPSELSAISQKYGLEKPKSSFLLPTPQMH